MLGFFYHNSVRNVCSLFICIIFSLSCVSINAAAPIVNYGILDNTPAGKIKKLSKKVKDFEKKAKSSGDCEKFFKSFCKDVESITGLKVHKDQLLNNIYPVMQSEGYHCSKEVQKNINSALLGKALKKSRETAMNGDESTVPVHVTIGVTMALCGYIISLIPYPGCIFWGRALVTFGTGLATKACCDVAEEERLRKKAFQERSNYFQ